MVYCGSKNAFTPTKLLYLNVAVTFLATVIVTLHAALPVQPTLQPVKVAVASGVAVKVTIVLLR